MPDILQLGTRFRHTRSALGQAAFSGGQTTGVKIPKGMLQKGIVVRLSGTLVVGVANAAAIFGMAPLGLMKSIQIIADNNKVLFTASGRDLFRLAHYYRGKQGEISPPVATAGTNAFAATINLDLEALRFFSPNDSYFDPRLYEDVSLNILWGQATDIATAGGGGGTIAIGGGTVADIIARQTVEGVTKILFDKLVTFIETQTVATTPNLVLNLPRSGLLPHILIRTDRDSADGNGPVLVDNIINFITIRTEQNVRHFDTLSWATAQRDSVQEFQLDGGATAGAQLPGFVFLDLTEDGMLSTALNVNSLNAADLVLDVTRTAGTETIRVTLVYFVPRSLPVAHAA